MIDCFAVRQFADKIALEGPPPGGGSIAAVTGLMSVSLLEALLRLSDKEEHYRRKTQLEDLRIALSALVERDGQALEELLEWDGGEVGREVVEQAAQVPLDTARLCLEVLEICKQVWPNMRPHAIGDLAVVAFQAHAGLEGALLGTVMNLPLMEEGNTKNAYQGQVMIIQEAAGQLACWIRESLLSVTPFSMLSRALHNDA